MVGYVPDVKIKVLGSVNVLRDGQPTGPRRQVGEALAVLVAAQGKPVTAEHIAAAIRRHAARDPNPSTVPKVIHELNELLAGGTLAIPRMGPRGYQLAPEASMHDAIDACRFLTLAKAASDHHARGEEDAALELFAKAAAEWGGPPFGTGWQHQLPESCRQFTSQLEQQRHDMVRRVIEIALRRGGQYAATAIFRDRPVGDGVTVDTAWLVTLLMTELRDASGVREAERVIAAAAQTDEAKRASRLASLCQADVQIHSPLAATRRRQVNGSPERIVGRDDELDCFRQMLDAVRDGRPATMIVRGGSGLGKTRLAEELAALATAADIPVVLVTRWTRGQLEPWQYVTGMLWANCLRDIGAGPDPLRPWQHSVLLDFARGYRPKQPGPDEDRGRQFSELADALSRLARHAAARRGLIIAFDDMEQFRERGLELLRDVRALLKDAPVGWLLTGWDTGTWPELPRLGHDEGLFERVLRPLPPTDVRDWVALVRDHGPAEVAAEAASVFENSLGVPSRICDTLTGGGELSAAHEAAADDMDLLAWAGAAAITATELEIDTELVRQILDLSDDEADRRQSAAAQRGRWRIDLTAAPRFTHSTYLEQVLTELNQHQALRRRLHEKAFELLSGRLRAARYPDPGLPERIAKHARSADRELDPADAARAYLAAAREKLAGYDAAAAADWARTGLRTTSDDLATRFGLHLALGDALEDDGAIRAADEQYTRACDMTQGRPRDQARAAILLARRWIDPGRVDSTLLIRLRNSLDGLADDGDAEAIALRLRLIAHLASKSALAVPRLTGMPPGPREDGLALADAALRQLEHTSDLQADVTCEVLNECRWATYDSEPPDRTVLLSQRLYDASIASHSGYFQSEALMALAIDQLRLGGITGAREKVQLHRQSLARGHRATWLQGTMNTLLALWDGDFDRAHRRLFGEARQTVERAVAENARSAGTLLQTWQGQVYWLMRERGQMRDLLATPVAQQIEQYRHFPIWRVAMILAFCDTGDLDRAARELDALARESGDFATFPPHGWTLPAVALLAESCLALSPAGPHGPQPHRLTGRLRQLLDQWPGEFVLAGWPTVLLGPVDRFSGVLATAAGDYAEAIRLFDEALAAVGAARPQVARLQLDKARALVRSGGTQARAESAELLAQAKKEAERLGMTPVADEAQQLLQQHRN